MVEADFEQSISMRESNLTRYSPSLCILIFYDAESCRELSLICNYLELLISLKNF